MTGGAIRFTLMTFVVAITVGLIMTILVGPTTGAPHLLLKYGYAAPSLLLTVDMWVHYDRYYANRDLYTYRHLLLDIVVLALSYIGLATLQSVPAASDAAFRDYPPRACWIALILYSALKTWRAWPLQIGGDGPPARLSWMSLLHAALLVLILSAWGWQRGFPSPVPVPFAWSGIVFTVLAAVYLVSVYVLRWDPMTPVGVNRRWSE